jgi:hypothetical protein
MDFKLNKPAAAELPLSAGHGMHEVAPAESTQCHSSIAAQE